MVLWEQAGAARRGAGHRSWSLLGHLQDPEPGGECWRKGTFPSPVLGALSTACSPADKWLTQGTSGCREAEDAFVLSGEGGIQVQVSYAPNECSDNRVISE